MMIGSDIQYAAQTCSGHPVLGPATQFLKALLDYTNANSDGWSYYPKPSRASAKLQAFITAHTGGLGYHPNATADRATIAEFKATLPPIRAMATREKVLQARYGNTFDFDVDATLQAVLGTDDLLPFQRVLSRSDAVVRLQERIEELDNDQLAGLVGQMLPGEPVMVAG